MSTSDIQYARNVHRQELQEVTIGTQWGWLDQNQNHYWLLFTLAAVPVAALSTPCVVLEQPVFVSKTEYPEWWSQLLLITNHPVITAVRNYRTKLTICIHRSAVSVTLSHNKHKLAVRACHHTPVSCNLSHLIYDQLYHTAQETQDVLSKVGWTKK